MPPPRPLGAATFFIAFNVASGNAAPSDGSDGSDKSDYTDNLNLTT